MHDGDLNRAADYLVRNRAVSTCAVPPQPHNAEQQSHSLHDLRSAHAPPPAAAPPLVHQRSAPLHPSPPMAEAGPFHHAPPAPADAPHAPAPPLPPPPLSAPPAAASGGAGADAVEWRFLHHSNWHRYGDAYAARLEAAWQSGLRSVVLDIETDSEMGTRYEVARPRRRGRRAAFLLRLWSGPVPRGLEMGRI
jgi:hypothetical protein